MSAKVWQGSGTAPLAWSTAGNWVGGVAPVNGDDAIFDGTGQAPVAGSDETAVALHSLVVYPTYTGNLGSSGANLAIHVNNGTLPYLQFMGTGALFFGTNSTSPTTTKMIINALSGSSATIHVGGTITEAIFLKGIAEILAGATVPTLTVAYVDNQSGDVALTVNTSVTLTTGNQRGGTVTAASVPATLTIDAGTFAQTGSGNITTLTLNAGIFYWQHSGDTITTLNLNGACTFDGTAINRASTLTTLNINHPGAIADLRSGGKIAAATIYSSCYLPQIRLDPGRKISLA